MRSPRCNGGAPRIDSESGHADCSERHGIRRCISRSRIKATTIDHISIQVSDLPRSIAFYQNVFGLSVVSEDKPNEIVRLGLTKTRVSLHHKSPTALVDHFAIGVDPFNKEAMTRHLKQHGLTPEENIDAGFHVKDPEGIRVQIVQAG